MAKKCKYWDWSKCKTISTCPKNTNNYCEIVPKPKCQIITKRPKYRKVRAWLFRYDGKWAHIHTGKKPTQFVEEHTPCFILIDEKHFKGEK